MPQNVETKHIVIIDKKPQWRKFSEEALAARGYAVHLYEDYQYPPPIDELQTPALVILGCAVVGQEELKLIEQIVAHGHYLIVLCTALPRDVMRSVFLIGADDVVDRPYSVNEFTEIIEHVLANITSRNVYQIEKGNL